MSCRRSKINKIREENTSLFYSWALRQRCVFLYIKHADYYIFLSVYVLRLRKDIIKWYDKSN